MDMGDVFLVVWRKIIYNKKEVFHLLLLWKPPYYKENAYETPQYTMDCDASDHCTAGVTCRVRKKQRF